ELRQRPVAVAFLQRVLLRQIRQQRQRLIFLAVAVERARVPLGQARVVGRRLDALGEQLLALGVLAEHQLAARHDHFEARHFVLLQPVRTLQLLRFGDRVTDAAGVERLLGVIDRPLHRQRLLGVRHRREQQSEDQDVAHGAPPDAADPSTPRDEVAYVCARAHSRNMRSAIAVCALVFAFGCDTTARRHGATGDGGAGSGGAGGGPTMSCNDNNAPDLEGCGCDGSDTRSCWDGPPNSENVGTCKDGTQTCAGGQWPTTCSGEVLPSTEACDDALDHNCNHLPGCLDVFSCATSPACMQSCKVDGSRMGCVCPDGSGDTATCPAGDVGITSGGFPGTVQCCPCTKDDCGNPICCSEAVCAGDARCVGLTCRTLPPSCGGKTNFDCDDFPEDCDEPCCTCTTCP